MNGNVPYFSGSKNTSTSWQYQGILDMNGDRYPDLVSFSDSQDGSNKFVVTEGTQGGFGRQSDYSLPGSGLLSVYNTKSYGLGASTSSASGGMLIKADPTGKPESIAIVKPDPTSGSSGAVGMGVNASFGSSVQSKGFYDMNGDGLPDFVTRSDTDSYRVALNKGDGTFAPFLDWGGAASERQFMPDFIDLTCRPSGLTTTGTGSFGATINASFGIMGASAGFNATVNQTYSALSDVNGDGLPDQVVKLKDEPFFRIRFNMGDQFGPELRLYRPDWGTPGTAYRDGIMQDLGRLSGRLGTFALRTKPSRVGIQSPGLCL